MLRNLPTLCRYLIFALIGATVLSLVLPSVMATFFPLFPDAVKHGEVWRLITFPFFILASRAAIIGTIFSLLWKGLIIAYFGGELETIVHTDRLAKGLIATILIAGILFTVLGASGGLGGPSVITMFILGGFAYMWPKREISIYGLFWVKTWIVALVIFFFSIIPSVGFLTDASASQLWGPVAGALGGIVYFHIMYRQYSFGRSIINRVEDKIPARPKKASVNDETISVQRRIDMILDKISRSGIDSLSQEEKDFLMRNSK